MGQAEVTKTVRFMHIGAGFQEPKMDILVADDDPSGRFLLNSTLVELGHSVTEAANGYDAWEAWKRGRQQLVISDWMMPGIDGLELCRRIRAEEASDFAYIILITARAGKANYLDAMDSGVDDFLEKPFDRDRFIARVRVAMRILDLHQSLGQRKRMEALPFHVDLFAEIECQSLHQRTTLLNGNAVTHNESGGRFKWRMEQHGPQQTIFLLQGSDDRVALPDIGPFLSGNVE